MAVMLCCCNCSHKRLRFLHNRNGAITAPLALHALPGVVLFQCSPAVPWSFSEWSALGSVGGSWLSRKSVVGLLVQRFIARGGTLGHLRLCSSPLAAHAAAVAPVTVKEQKPYTDPDKCNCRNCSDTDEQSNSGSRNASSG